MEVSSQKTTYSSFPFSLCLIISYRGEEVGGWVGVLMCLPIEKVGGWVGERWVLTLARWRRTLLSREVSRTWALRPRRRASGVAERFLERLMGLA